MPITRRDGNGNHGYAVPVALIVVLMSGYWVISEWHALTGLIELALTAIR